VTQQRRGLKDVITLGQATQDKTKIGAHFERSAK